MDKKKFAIAAAALGVIGGGFAYAEAVKYKDLIENGILQIDTSPSMPSYISTVIHNANILPKSVPLMYIVKVLTGTPAEQNKYAQLLQTVLKYIDIKLVKPAK